jgi:hypothetical protein
MDLIKVAGKVIGTGMINRVHNDSGAFSGFNRSARGRILKIVLHRWIDAIGDHEHGMSR